MIATGDRKPQMRRRMLSAGGSVHIKNSCQKRREDGDWRELQREETGKPEGGTGRRRRRQWFILLKPFILRVPQLSPNGQRAHSSTRNSA